MHLKVGSAFIDPVKSANTIRNYYNFFIITFPSWVLY